MKITATFFCLFLAFQLSAQPGSEALTKDNKTLQERYYLLKTKSQTFKDYKVIKETVLDGMWTLIIDSVKAGKKTLGQARVSIAQLDSSLSKTKLELQQKQESMLEVEHASTHISFLGIDFTKGFFITLTLIIVSGLVVFIGVIITRLKLIHKSYREKADTVDELNHEFDEFKRKAMEKQTKLSRELQDERNKIQSMRSM